MKTKKLSLTEQQQHNLLTFLDRVQLKGFQETNEFLKIVGLIQNAKEECEDVEQILQPSGNK